MKHDSEWVHHDTPDRLPVEGRDRDRYFLDFCFSDVELVGHATKPVLTCARRGGVGSVQCLLIDIWASRCCIIIRAPPVDELVLAKLISYLESPQSNRLYFSFLVP